MSNINNNNNAPRSSGASRKRARAPGNAAAPGSQGAAKKQKTRRNRNRKARNGRAMAEGNQAALARGDQLTAKGGTRNGYGNKQSVPLEETEYIAEVVPTAFPAFSVQTFPVNPGQAATFPWLARVAQNFEKYEFEYLAFIYKREVSEFATNGVTGKVIMSFDSDATDPAPTGKQVMEDTDPHCDCMPSENMVLVVPPAMLRRFNDAKFVRPGAQPANTDLKTYDIGTLYVACQGTAANTAVGELHVHYRMRLRIPTLTPGVGAGALASGGGTIAAATPFGAVPVATGTLTLSGAGTKTLTAFGLSIGTEYVLNAVVIGTVVTAVYADTLVGLTSKTQYVNMINAGGTNGATINTFTATAATASLALEVAATTVTGTYVTFVPLVPSPVF